MNSTCLLLDLFGCFVDLCNRTLVLFETCVFLFGLLLELVSPAIQCTPKTLLLSINAGLKKLRCCLVQGSFAQTQAG